jgi:hypothetical protein
MTHWLPEDLWQQFHPQAAVQDDVNGLRSGCTNNDFGSGTTPEPAVTKPRALQSPQFPVMVPVTIFSVL